MTVDDGKPEGQRADTPSDEDVIREFKELPKLYAEREVTIEFTTDGTFRGPKPSVCDALNLTVGATVADYCRLTASESLSVMVLAEGDMARTLRSFPKGTSLTARGTTKFGTYEEVEYSDHGSVTETNMAIGIVLSEVHSS